MNHLDPEYNHIIGMILQRAPTLNGHKIKGEDKDRFIALTLRWFIPDDFTIYEVPVHVTKSTWLDLLNYVDVESFAFYVQYRCNVYLQNLGLKEEVQMHTYYQCTPDCADQYCNYCVGGLSMCMVCGGAESQLTTECPGVVLNDEQFAKISKGTLGYVGGK